MKHLLGSPWRQKKWRNVLQLRAQSSPLLVKPQQALHLPQRQMHPSERWRESFGVVDSKCNMKTRRGMVGERGSCKVSVEGLSLEVK